MNSSTAIATESGHWYTRTGAPCYEVENKSKGGMRPTTIRDARKLDLVPSVTTILRVMANPMLENWKRDQVLLSAATSPHKREDMTAEEWAAKVKEDAEAQSKAAMEKGTAIHGAIERFLIGETITDYKDYAVQVVEYLEARGHLDSSQSVRVEHSFAHALGYGGKVDFFNDKVLVDFKTKDFTTTDIEQGKKFAYPEHCYQLSAYAVGLNLRHSHRMANMFISTSVPGLIVWHEWSEEEISKGWEIFSLCLELWKKMKL